jgi:hypothetical protein
LGVLSNPHDPAVTPDENHVERDVGIFHPEANFLVGVEVEQHALPLRQFLPIHQALRALGIGRRQFHGKGMDTCLAGDLNDIPIGRPSGPGRQQQTKNQKSKPPNTAHGWHLGGRAHAWQ